jgi:ATP-dependent NAD(P)H-hydrate dehydratase
LTRTLSRSNESEKKKKKKKRVRLRNNYYDSTAFASAMNFTNDYASEEGKQSALKEFGKYAVPDLERTHRTNHKGSKGKKIGIVGGSRDYTGAPYFAAMSSARTGADLVHIFSHEKAAAAIKNYSPDLIVHSVLKDTKDIIEKFTKNDVSERDFGEAFEIFLNETRDFVNRMDAVVIGPGLGRDFLTWQMAIAVYKLARENNIPVVFDADALFMIHKYHKGEDFVDEGSYEFRIRQECKKVYDKCKLEEAEPLDGSRTQSREKLSCTVFTPNAREVSYGFDPNDTAAFEKTVTNFITSIDLELKFQQTAPMILAKGVDDIFVSVLAGEKQETSQRTKFENIEGSKKRCGGQGDILTGVLAVFLAWSNAEIDQSSPETCIRSSRLACFCASALTREAARKAYEKNKRSLQSSDILLELREALESLFPSINTY